MQCKSSHTLYLSEEDEADEEEFGVFQASCVKFPDRSKEKKNITPIATNYRLIAPGLNFQGTCVNENCIAANKKVWVRKGFITIYMHMEIYQFRCPQCIQLIEDVTKCGYYMTRLKVYGIKGIGQRVRWTRTVNEENAITFFEEDDNSRFENWRYLMMVAYQLPKVDPLQGQPQIEPRKSFFQRLRDYFWPAE